MKVIKINVSECGVTAPARSKSQFSIEGDKVSYMFCIFTRKMTGTWTCLTCSAIVLESIPNPLTSDILLWALGTMSKLWAVMFWKTWPANTLSTTSSQIVEMSTSAKRFIMGISDCCIANGASCRSLALGPPRLLFCQVFSKWLIFEKSRIWFLNMVKSWYSGKNFMEGGGNLNIQ